MDGSSRNYRLSLIFGMELKTHSMQTVSVLACGKQIKRDCCSRIGEDFGSLIRNRCDHAVRYLTMQRAHRVTEGGCRKFRWQNNANHEIFLKSIYFLLFLMKNWFTSKQPNTCTHLPLIKHNIAI